MTRKYIYFGSTTEVSWNFQKFIWKLENRINSDEELLDRGRETNKEFAARVAEMVNDPNFSENAGNRITTLITKTPRYSYIKNLQFNEQHYEAEIDHLTYKFKVMAV